MATGYLAAITPDSLTADLFGEGPSRKEKDAKLAGYIKTLAEKTGVIPLWNATKKYFRGNDEPTYLGNDDQRSTLRSLFTKARDATRKYFGSKFDMAPYATKREKLGIADLPTYVMETTEVGIGGVVYQQNNIVPVVIDSDGVDESTTLPAYKMVFNNGRDYIKRVLSVVGQVGGVHNPETAETYIDPSTIEGSPKRNFLKRLRAPVLDAYHTLVHEYVHRFQTSTGFIGNTVRKFGRNARAVIEGGAETHTANITGKAEAYPTERGVYQNMIRHLTHFFRGDKKAAERIGVTGEYPAGFVFDPVPAGNN